MSRPVLGPTQPPIYWVLGALSAGVKRQGREAGHAFPSNAEVTSQLLHVSSPSTETSVLRSQSLQFCLDIHFLSSLLSLIEFLGTYSQ